MDYHYPQPSAPAAAMVMSPTAIEAHHDIHLIGGHGNHSHLSNEFQPPHFQTVQSGQSSGHDHAYNNISKLPFDPTLPLPSMPNYDDQGKVGESGKKDNSIAGDEDDDVQPELMEWPSVDSPEASEPVKCEMNELNNAEMTAEEKGKYVCDMCARRFRDKSNLKKHIKNIHSQKSTSRKAQVNGNAGERPFECNICHSRFKQSGSLQKHRKRIHKQQDKAVALYSETDYDEKDLREKTFVCDVCHKRFKYPSELRFHQMSHSDARPFACDECPAKFKEKRTLERHWAGVHKRKIEPEDDSETEELDDGERVRRITVEIKKVPKDLRRQLQAILPEQYLSKVCSMDAIDGEENDCGDGARGFSATIVLNLRTKGGVFQWPEHFQ